VDIKPIKTEADYGVALEETEEPSDAEPDTLEGDRLEVLATLVEAYEAKRHPVPLPDPIDPVEHHVASRGLSRKDLEPHIGRPGRVSEILKRRRLLALRIIRSPSEGLGIPAEVLTQPYDLACAAEAPGNDEQDQMLVQDLAITTTVEQRQQSSA
jgi:HTH-type transcriptional regulator/antitoxin HigA